jgi:hypothetical protein
MNDHSLYFKKVKTAPFISLLDIKGSSGDEIKLAQRGNIVEISPLRLHINGKRVVMIA